MDSLSSLAISPDSNFDLAFVSCVMISLQKLLVVCRKRKMRTSPFFKTSAILHWTIWRMQVSVGLLSWDNSRCCGIAADLLQIYVNGELGRLVLIVLPWPKKLRTAARTWRRRVISRACTRLCLACITVSSFLARVVEVCLRWDLMFVGKLFFQVRFCGPTVGKEGGSLCIVCTKNSRQAFFFLEKLQTK